MSSLSTPHLDGGYTTTISGGTFLGSNVTSMTHNKKPNQKLGLHIISDYLSFVKNLILKAVSLNTFSVYRNSNEKTISSLFVILNNSSLCRGNHP